ncbi:MAG: CCA tRNA nucleotidyltransferase [Clostridia bacterium]|nr:CCA tRNA nucleotidyltransferase [Clostridia bacterium]
MLVLSQGAKKALELLHNSGYEAYVVGGSVRDMLMGTKAHDFDITTSATPSQMKKVFDGYYTVDTGIKHGTITFVYEKEPIEITTYRIDGDYKDSRHPERVEFTTNLSNDLSRRDFTINALVYNDSEGIIDLFGGQNDIKNKTIKAIGDPKKRFEEDALRILRGVRFASQLGFEIEENTKNAMKECAHLLHNISCERINIELSKFLLGKNVKKALLENYEIIGEIIPQIKEMHGFEQNNKYHIYDVLTHTAVAIENIEPILHLRLSMLLHDSGKPKTYSIDENGQGHFYGHARVSTEIAEAFLNKYRYDNQTKEKVITLVKIHDTPIELDRVFIKKRMNRIGKDLFFDLLKVKRADNLAQNPEFFWLDKLDKFVTIAKEIIEEDCFTLSSLDIRGSDLIAIGFKGKEIGNTLNLLLNEVIEEKLPNKKEALIERAKKLI